MTWRRFTTLIYGFGPNALINMISQEESTPKKKEHPIIENPQELAGFLDI